MIISNLYQHRSAPSSISAAYVLLLDNRKEVFRRLILPAIAFGISISLCLLAYTPNKTLNEWGLAHPVLTLLLLVSAAVLAIGASFWLVASTFTMINGERTIMSLRRCGVAAIGFVLYNLLNFGVQYLCMNVLGSFLTNRFADKAVTVMTVCSLLNVFISILVMVVFQPYLYSTVKYLYDHTMTAKSLFTTDYLRGWKSVGHIFLTIFLASIILTIVILIASTPFAIAYMAQVSNQIGMLEGDLSGAPSYLLWLVMGISAVTMTLMAFALVWKIFVLIFLYGSIETKDESTTPSEK